MSAVKYQTMPPLSTDEYSDLEASILANGIQVPVIVDDHGVVIDGHHRKAIAEHHGLHLPTETRSMLTEAQKHSLSIELNIARRQLNREQKRAIVEAALKAQPEKSNREHARSLGVDHKTVGAARDALESTGEIPQFDKTVGADGKERPASRPAPVEVEGFTVDQSTGEIIDGPTIEPAPVVEEHTVTEKVKTVTGLDGKEYKRPEPKPVPTGDNANRLNAVQASKAIGSALETLLGLTYTNYRSGMLTDWWPLGKDSVPPSQSELFTPSKLRHIAQGLTATATEMEAQRV